MSKIQDVIQRILQNDERANDIASTGEEWDFRTKMFFDEMDDFLFQYAPKVTRALQIALEFVEFNCLCFSCSHCLAADKIEALFDEVPK